MRISCTLALIPVVCFSCISALAQQQPPVLRMGVTVLRSTADTVSLIEARDRLIDAINRQKPDKKLGTPLQAVALDAPSGPMAIVEAREKNCQFVLSTHLTNLATTYEASSLDGTNLPDFHAFIVFQLDRASDGSEVAGGSLEGDDGASMRNAIWRALSRIASRSSSEIIKGKGMPNAPADAAVPEIPAAAPSLMYIGNEREYCSWLPSDVAHADALRAACEYAITLPQKMPNFICEQNVARYRANSRAPVDLISASVRYEDGHESYSDVKVNGKSSSGEADRELGLRSTGEFASDLRAIFNRPNHAQFKFSGERNLSDRVGWVFTYQIADQKQPLWMLQAPGQTLSPPYSGELWIDEKDGTVLRFRSVAQDLPPNFPMKSVELEIDYEKILFADGTDFVLPVDYTLANVFAGQDPSRNVVQFRNCHKFRAKAFMILNAGAATGAAPTSQVPPDLDSVQKDLRTNEAIFNAIRDQALQDSEASQNTEQNQTLNAITNATVEKLATLRSQQQTAQNQDAENQNAESKSEPQLQASRIPVAVPAAEPLTTLKVKVNLVLVSVVLRDANGHALGNLAKENFQLMDEGKPQVITQFSVESTAPGTPPEDETAAPPADAQHSVQAATEQSHPATAQRDTAYLFDDVHLSSQDLAAARAAAIRHLGSLQASERMALFTTSGAVIVNFTNDREKLLAGLRTLKPHAMIPESDCPPISHYMADLMLNKQDSEAKSIAVAEATDCAMRGTFAGPHAAHLAAAKALEALNIGNAESKNSLGVLKNVIRTLESMPGQRTIVLVSPGFLALAEDTHEDVMEITNAAVRSGIVINTLDAHGLYFPDPDRTQFDSAEAEARGALMTDFASSTGGTFFHNNSDLDEGFRRTAGTPEYVYVLGFSPQKLDGKFHKLKVRLNGSQRLTVQARQGYYALKPASGG